MDGIYDADPLKNPKAQKFETLTYLDVLKQGLKVMDTTAISLCMDNQLPIIVYDLRQQGQPAAHRDRREGRHLVKE